MKYYIFLFTIIFYFIAISNSLKTVFAEETKLKKYLCGATIAGGTYFGFHEAYRFWWKESNGKFKFQNDSSYAKNFDKFGHFYSGKLISDLSTSLLYGMELPEKKARLYSSITASVFALIVEIKDGLTNYGFSYFDLLSSAAGAWLPYYQLNTKSFIKDIQIKIRYSKSDYKASDNLDFMQDYEGMKFWVCYPVEKIFNTKKIKGLNIAAGVGMDRNSHNERYKSFWLSFDISPTSLFGIKKTPVTMVILENYHFIKAADIRIDK